MTRIFGLLAAAPPAGGAELGQVAIASLAATLVTLGLLYLGFGHRSGRGKLREGWAAQAERLAGMPGWAVLPAAIATTSLLTALFGMYWDISLHIDNGRDPGPLANPAHYFILAGLVGVLPAGCGAVVLPREKPSAVAVRLGRDWWAPLGGVLICACGAFSLIGFPLDDIWHRLFGQDVTLWGPTHLMLITGAGLSIVGILILEQEGHGGLSPDDGDTKVGQRTRFIRQVAAMGGLLLGLSVFQGEFDFDVEQFRLVLSPFMIAGAAGLALVAARLFMGSVGPVAPTAFFLVVRGVIALLVGPILGQVTPTFPLYLGSAILVELL